MLRVATSAVARRAMMQTPRGLAPRSMAFHASERREEEAKPVAVPESKGGLLGSGLSEWYALPIGIAAAVPIIQFDWYVINEETQLAAVFIAFCVTLYTQAGDAIYKALDQNAQTLLKDHTEAEEKVIAALEEKLHFLKANQNMVNDFQAINALRENAYNNLNAAGIVKPKHDFKAQVERVLQMIAVEEANVTEKTKVTLMSEATAAVTAEFTSSKAMKKAALDSAIATIEGSTGKKEDPVQAAFVKFFKEKAAEAAKTSGDAEEKAQREALIAKINGVAKGEKFFFEFDDKGVPKMIV